MRAGNSRNFVIDVVVDKDGKPVFPPRETQTATESQRALTDFSSIVVRQKYPIEIDFEVNVGEQVVTAP